ncbi:MAG: hypothetical protein IPN22_04100 [Bacteroidetes bacterium]|nr:hypothetical protein [Bacteroidota bacterium]
MKRIFTCLLGMGLLLHGYAAPGKANMSKRIVEVNLTGWELVATSEPADGKISQVQVIPAGSRTPVVVQYCDGYICGFSLYGLPSGTYEVKVICANTVYVDYITL